MVGRLVLVSLVAFAFISRAQNRDALPPVKRAYVDAAMRNDGDVSRGKQLFADEQKLGCTKCHSIDGSSSKAGPDLLAIGDKFPRRELVRSIIEPSANIAVGYGTTIVETRDDEEFQGVVKQASDTFVELKGGDGQTMRIATRDIKQQRTSEISLMPDGLESALSHAEFADLIAYMESLRQPANAVAFTQGMPAQIPLAAHGVELRRFFSESIRLNRPLWFGEVPGRTNMFVALEHGGRSWIIERGTNGDTQRSFVDLSRRVRVGGASGLLGLAFHPRFQENRKYYLKYQIVENGRISTLLVERTFAPDFSGDSGDTERELMKIPAVTQDHLGGCIEFGPNGFLYLGMGDTGPQQDPQGHGQDMTLLLGKILRIDVDRRDGDRAYAIPTDNPFRNTPNTRPEIWALGFREPWRFSFDRANGEFWVGDVGQDRVEEIAIVRAGENHGWNVFEGFTPFSNRYRRDDAKYVPPIFAYPHRVGVSVTAGHTYRGKRAPQMVGQHICGDFESRRMWALAQTNRVLNGVVEIGRAPTRIASFTQDSAGELYLVGYDDGIIYQLNLAPIDPTPLESRIIVATSEHGATQWRYSLQRPTENWSRADFDDGSWTSAPGGFGTQGTPGATVRTDWHTSDIWLRREFTLTDALPENVQSTALRLHHDEDAEVFINGVEAARLPRWTSSYVEVPLEASVTRTLRPGRNVIAIHCHQNGGGQYIDAGIVVFVKARQFAEAKPGP